MLYQRLVDSFKIIREIAIYSGINILELNISIQDITDIEPSDVYDIASLIVSEVAFFHSRLNQFNEPRIDLYFSEEKYPSHVFQRAGILEAQLKTLRNLVAKNPGWLSHH